MKTYEVVVLVVFALIILTLAAFAIGDSIKERRRRNKHPEWYKYYNRALSNSMYAGQRFREKAETINKRKELVQETFFDGRCSADDFSNAMNMLNTEYNEAAKLFSLEQESLGIMRDLEAADAYAKEHNLKWGVLYK